MTTAIRNPIVLSVLILAACAAGEQKRAPSVIRAEAGELGVVNACAPFPGVLTAGQLSEEQLAALAGAGYRLFVNLRTEDEHGTGWEARSAAELGVRCVSLPIAGAADVTEANARRLTALLADAQGPAVVYCRSSNRVGALFALAAFHVDGKSADESLDIGRAAGLSKLEPHVRNALDL